MSGLETELAIAYETIREADESFRKLRKDYQNLRAYADQLEGILLENGIDFPDFCGW